MLYYSYCAIFRTQGIRSARAVADDNFNNMLSALARGNYAYTRISDCGLRRTHPFTYYLLNYSSLLDHTYSKRVHKSLLCGCLPFHEPINILIFEST